MAKWNNQEMFKYSSGNNKGSRICPWTLGFQPQKTKPNPTTKRGIDRLKTESEWLNCFNNFGLPIQIFRLSGIYSKERNVIKRIQSGKINLVEKKIIFFLG